MFSHTIFKILVALTEMSLSQQHMDLSCLLFSSFHYHKLESTCVNSVCYISMCFNSSYMLISRWQRLHCSAFPHLNWAVKSKDQCTRSHGTSAHWTPILRPKVPLHDVNAGNGETGYGPMFYVHTQPIPSEM